MEDISSLTNKELRELLIKYEDNPPPVNASTRGVLEQKIRRCQDESSTNLSETTEIDSNLSTPLHDSIKIATPPSTPATPAIVRFEAKPDIHHIYEQEYTPSYCRKSLNEYRDKKYESPKYNLLDKPGYTPHARKHETNSLKHANSGKVFKSLVLILIMVLIGIGIYFLLTWDPSFVNPIES